MATATLFLDERYCTKKGYHVKVRIYHAGKQIDFSTKIYATEGSYFTALQKTAKSKANQALRLKLDTAQAKANAILSKMNGSFSVSRFRAMFYNEIAYHTKGAALHLADLYAEKTKELETNKQFKHLGGYRSSLNSLTDFKPGIVLQDITTQMLNEYERWVLAKGNSLSTVYTYLRPLRSVYRKAIEHGFIHIDTFPFGRGKYVIGHSDSARRALLPTDIKKLWEYRPKNQAQKRAIDFWFFSYHCNGIAPIDIAYLKKEDLRVDHIVFQRHKTKRTKRKPKDVVVYLSDDVKTIIQRQGSNSQNAYLFPIFEKGMTENERYLRIEKWKGEQNQVLRRIGEKLNLHQSPCLYAGRHSFSDALGHAEVNVKTAADALGQETIYMAMNYMGNARVEKIKKLSSLTMSFKDQP